MSIEPHINIDECIQRYIAAFDEINYVAEQLAAHMSIAVHYEPAKDYLNAMVEKAEDLIMDLENIRDDAESEDE